MSSVATTDVLNANAEFTSEWQPRRLGQSRIWGTVFADKAGTLHLEQSTDGANVDVDEPIEVKASDGQGFTEEFVGRFWRLRHVNGGTKQTAFRLSAQAS